MQIDLIASGTSLLQSYAALFMQAGVENPWREVRLLACHVTNLKYETLLFQDSIDFNQDQRQALHQYALRRLQDEPLSKIIGCREFWGLKFEVNQDTLDPRADSETLIEAVLQCLEDYAHSYEIIDFGTGTGCLLLSLLSELPSAYGLGIDKSEAALKVAKRNAVALGMEGRANFCLADWGNSIESQFDIIISNPPYIGLYEPLEVNVREYDPDLALYGGEDGLKAYRCLLPHIKRLSHKRTKVFLEIGHTQAEAVAQIAKSSSLELCRIYKDLAGRDRVLSLIPIVK